MSTSIRITLADTGHTITAALVGYYLDGQPALTQESAEALAEAWAENAGDEFRGWEKNAPNSMTFGWIAPGSSSRITFDHWGPTTYKRVPGSLGQTAWRLDLFPFDLYVTDLPAA